MVLPPCLSLNKNLTKEEVLNYDFDLVIEQLNKELNSQTIHGKI